MERFVTGAYRSAMEALHSLSAFVTESSELSPRTAPYQSALYRSWILSLYADIEASVSALFGGMRRHLGASAVTFDLLPPEVARSHLELSLSALGRTLTEDDSIEDMKAKVSQLVADDWFDHSTMGRPFRNVWHAHVVQMHQQCGGSAAELKPLNQGRFGDRSCAAVLDRLVKERNNLAHGSDVGEVRSAEEVLADLEVLHRYLMLLRDAIVRSLVRLQPASLEPIGEVDPDVILGQRTVPIVQLATSVHVGDTVFIDRGDGRRISMRVLSMQSDNEELQAADGGRARVALSLSGEGPFGDVWSSP